MDRRIKVNIVCACGIFFLMGLINKARADIIRLKNGRSIEGAIKSQDDKIVEVDFGIMALKVAREDIERIDKSAPQDNESLLEQWKRAQQSEAAKSHPKKSPESQELGYKKSNKGIVVVALINNTVKASLIVDTGAATVLLSQRIGRELGFGTGGLKEGKLSKIVLADGSEAIARRVLLDSLAIEGVEAKNIEAAVLTSEGEDDGLLGRSFLNKFNFQVDSLNKKLTLKEVEPQEVTAEEGDFSFRHPSDWEKVSYQGKLILSGPPLPGEDGEYHKPTIMIQKDTDETSLNYAKGLRDMYFRLKDKPDSRKKMSELVEESFKATFHQNEFISSEFEEAVDFLRVSTVYHYRQYKAKVRSVKLIRKTDPVRSYTLDFISVGKYFDEYLPVFNKCLTSFTPLENEVL